MTIIGITGRARAGKSTVAELLVARDHFELVSFAEPVKQLAVEINPGIGTYVMGNDDLGYDSGVVHLAKEVDEFGWEYVKDHYPEARKFLQGLGNGARKTFGQDIWVDVWSRRVDDIQSNASAAFQRANIVAPDVRYVNEAAYIRALGGHIWRVNRAGPVSTDDHVSETEMDLIEPDAIVHNDTDLADLAEVVGHLLDLTRRYAA